MKKKRKNTITLLALLLVLSLLFCSCAKTQAPAQETVPEPAAEAAETEPVQEAQQPEEPAEEAPQETALPPENEVQEPAAAEEPAPPDPVPVQAPPATDVPAPETPPETPEPPQSASVTFSISCETALASEELDPAIRDVLPADGWILGTVSVEIEEGESVFDVLQRVCREYGIALEHSKSPIYDSAYIEGIGHLYEFDCGNLSGWEYSVNGWYPNYGCSKAYLNDGDVVCWKYTCDLGKDIGAF